MVGEPNLRILKPSRKAPRPGDVFVLSPADGVFVFGRVVATDAKVGLMDAVLIYVYAPVRAEASPPWGDLSPEQLLIPPVLTNRLPWSRGYFEVVGNRELGAADRLPVHCFRDSRGWFFDEFSKPLEGPSEPVGQRALQSFRTIDDAVCDALGIPRAAE